MKVHLIKSPELNPETYQKIVNVVRSVEGGSITFIGTDFEFNREDYYFLRYSLYPNHPFQYLSNQEKISFKQGLNFPLSWRELFRLCEDYRRRYGIGDDDFVILLTDRKNALNWFSASDGARNIFIHTAEWEHYTTLSIEYPIAHQIAENIFQVLMGVDLVNIPNKYAHSPLRGCINDICMDKFEVIAKLKSGSICSDCVMKIRESFTDWQVAKQLQEILIHVRNKYDLNFFDLPEDDLSPIVFNKKDCQLTFQKYNKTVPLYPLEATLYLYFIENPEGSTLANLKTNEVERLKLASIYVNLNPNVTPKEALIIIENLLNNNFSTNKSKINKKIEENIANQNISQNYIISGGRAQTFSVSISNNAEKVINNRENTYRVVLHNGTPILEKNGLPFLQQKV